jgi:hypothetical protein
MTHFRTDVSITSSPNKIGLKNPIFTAGSCFANAIGLRLMQNKFKTLSNPFGVLYNPISIHKALRYAIHQEPPADHTYLSNHGLNLNYDFHSEFSHTEKSALTSQIQNSIGSSHFFLRDAAWIMITYGTSWVYARKDSGEIVANCHKIPSSSFTKSLLTEHEIADSFKTFFESLTAFNPHVRIILTVSPVRHLKDTLELNSVSKSIARLACYRITEKFPAVEYFPAYEIMMDDLRDYRFYKSDMLHPSKDAEDYIWKKFSDRYFDEVTTEFLKKWQSIRSALLHKPFHLTSPAHQQFLKETLVKLTGLKNTVDISEEAAFIEAQLSSKS